MVFGGDFLRLSVQRLLGGWGWGSYHWAVRRLSPRWLSWRTRWPWACQGVRVSSGGWSRTSGAGQEDCWRTGEARSPTQTSWNGERRQESSSQISWACRAERQDSTSECFWFDLISLLVNRFSHLWSKPKFSSSSFWKVNSRSSLFLAFNKSLSVFTVAQTDVAIFHSVWTFYWPNDICRQQ